MKHIGYAVDKVDGLLSNVGYVRERLCVKMKTVSLIFSSGSLTGCPIGP